jgi:hypothetical protein
MSQNVGASTSCNPKGLHGLYRDSFTLNVFWRNGYIPEELGVAVVIPTYKKETEKTITIIEVLVCYTEPG